MICSTDPSKFESSKLLETVVSLLNKEARNESSKIYIPDMYQAFFPSNGN